MRVIAHFFKIIKNSLKMDRLLEGQNNDYLFDDGKPDRPWLKCKSEMFDEFKKSNGGIEKMELYDSKRCQDLKQRIEDTDSIKENHRLVNMYLAERIRCVERVMANEFPDEVSYQEMIECLWEDLKLAQKQIQYTYSKVLD